MNKKNLSTLKFVDLFCGIGGFRMAGENLGMKCVFSSDIDVHSCKTYETNFGENPYSDIFKVETNEVDDFDLLFAGFPCQPFSYSGKGEGFNDKRGTLFYEVLRFLNEKQPKAFLLENVKGLVSHDRNRTLKVIEEELAFAGYNIHWTVLNSADYGLAQNRERWYCVGFKKDLEFEFPKPLDKKIQIKEILVKGKIDNDLGISSKWIKRIEKHLKSNEARVKHNDFDKNSKRGQHGVFSFMKPDKTIRFHMGDVKKTQIQEGFFTSVNSLSPTVIANRVPQLWDLKRKLTVRECARLQGFPDSFQFPVSRQQAYKQLGNSVSVPVIQSIIKEMLISLGYVKGTNQSRSLDKVA